MMIHVPTQNQRIRFGSIFSIAALVPLGFMVLFMLYAAITQSIVLSTQGQIEAVIILGVLLATLGLVLSVIGAGFTGSVLWFNRHAVQRRGIVVGGAALLLGTFLCLGVMVPRVLALERMSSTMLPFAQSLKQYCATPLLKINSDVKQLRATAEQYRSDNQGFEQAIQINLAQFQQDAAAMSTDQASLATLQAPDSNTQSLVDQCGQLLDSVSTGAQEISVAQNAGSFVASWLPMQLLPDGTLQDLTIQVLDSMSANQSQAQFSATAQQFAQAIDAPVIAGVAPCRVDFAALAKEFLGNQDIGI